MIATILAIVACLLILGATALALIWVTVADRHATADLEREMSSRTRSGPYRVHPADDLTRIADAVTDDTGRAL